jgi:hypothetical protein
MFLVRLGKPGAVQVSAVLGFRVQVNDAQYVHQGFMGSGLLHKVVKK